MMSNMKLFGIASIGFLAALAVHGPASAETSQMWCEFSGGTWHGATLSDGSSSTSKGICSFALVASAPDRAKLACTSVGGTVSKAGASQRCAVESANFPKAKASAEFRAVTVSSGKR